LQLILALHANRFPTARRLAELCEVSRRTVYRDIDILEEAAVPVKYDPERQGYHLPSEFAFPHAGLEEEELRALVLLCQPGRGGDGSGICRQARGAAWKLIAALRPDMRERIQTLAEWVQVRGETVSFPPERHAVYNGLLSALERKVQIRLFYCDRESLASESTKVTPYRLLIDGARWYLIGRSTKHRGVKVFHLPWIERVELTTDPATVPPRFDLERFLGRAWVVERGKHVKVVLRFSPRAAPEVREHQWHASQRVEPREDGSLDLYLSLDGDQEVVSWILSFADQVKVIAPRALRAHVAQICKRMAQLQESE